VVDFSSAQFLKGFYDMCIRLYGPLGALDSHYGLTTPRGIEQYYNGYVKIFGDRPWSGASHDETFTQGAITNVKNFIQSIRTGRHVNNVAESVDSNLTAILGRTAAYRGGTVTWDEMLDLNVKLEANLKI